MGSWLPIWYGRRPASNSNRITPSAYTSLRVIQLQRIGQHLLGAHVGQRPHELSQIGLARGLGIGIGGARHAEIDDLGLAGLIHQDVARFQIAMDDAPLVRMVHGFADLDHQLQPLPRAQVVRLGIPQQRRALNELHGEIRLRAESAIGGAGFIDLRDAGMVQAAERLGFVLEAPQQLAGWRGRA